MRWEFSEGQKDPWLKECVKCSSKTEKKYTDLMSMLGLKETIDQLAIANSVRWYGHVVRRALDLEVEGQRETKEDEKKAG